MNIIQKIEQMIDINTKEIELDPKDWRELLIHYEKHSLPPAPCAPLSSSSSGYGFFSSWSSETRDFHAPEYLEARKNWNEEFNKYLKRDYSELNFIGPYGNIKLKLKK